MTKKLSVEDERIRRMSPEEFKDWFAKKYPRARCEVDPSHLVGSYDHRRLCVERGRSQ